MGNNRVTFGNSFLRRTATTGESLWNTSVVLVFGFATLSFSSFRLNSSLGILTSLSIVFALVADLLLLPAMLLFFRPKVCAECTGSFRRRANGKKCLCGHLGRSNQRRESTFIASVSSLRICSEVGTAQSLSLVSVASHFQ